MTIKLRPPKSQLAQLSRIAEFGPDRISKLTAQFAEEQKLLMHPRLLVAVAAKIFDQSDAELLVSQLVSLYGLVRRTGTKPSEVVAGIGEALQSHSEFRAFNWDSVAPAFADLLNSRQVRIAATSVDLTFDYANLVRSIRILTDIRPLFSENADEIEAAVVSHTLRLHYDSSDGNHELSLALDTNDLRNLIAQSERAIKKSETAKTRLLNPVNIPSVISGELFKD